MSVVLAYPTVASPTTQVTLDDHVEMLPHSRPLRVYQSAFDTDSGVQIVYDWGASSRVFTVTLYPLTSSAKTEIENFFETTVNAREKAWQFLDALGVTWDVRFAQDVLEVLMAEPTRFSVTLTLRETA